MSITSFNYNEYVREKIIGKGSFGVVYCAKKANGERVAIKEIDLFNSDDEATEISKEIEMLLTCESPYVVKYHGCFTTNSKLLIFMEYMDFGSIRDLLEVQPMNEKQISVVLEQTLSALFFLHGRLKIHRDIKAANILVNYKGEVKLADFGVGTSLETRTKASTFVGSPFWMAPEVITETSYDERCDIWSLGITAIEMANGMPPLHDKKPQDAIRLIPYNDPPELPSKFSKEFRDFVARCLVKDPSQRPSARELLEHPFIKKGKNREPLLQYINVVKPFLQDMDDYEDEYVEEYEEEEEEEKPDWIYNTLITERPKAKSQKTYLQIIESSLFRTSREKRFEKIFGSFGKLGGLFIACDARSPTFCETFIKGFLEAQGKK